MITAKEIFNELTWISDFWDGEHITFRKDKLEIYLEELEEKLTTENKPETFEQWFELASLDFFTEVDPLSPHYYRLKSCWNAATQAAVEKFTPTNIASPKLLDAYSELEDWAIKNCYNNDHVYRILAKIEQLRSNG
jgi:hypothetical protein